MDEIRQILEARGNRYGNYKSVGTTAQLIKDTLRAGDTWNCVGLESREALEMIASKMARIVNGDPFYKDNWDDIIGYAMLARDAQSSSPGVKSE
jgi:hypothetical protein